MTVRSASPPLTARPHQPDREARSFEDAITRDRRVSPMSLRTARHVRVASVRTRTNEHSVRLTPSLGPKTHASEKSSSISQSVHCSRSTCLKAYLMAETTRSSSEIRVFATVSSENRTRQRPWRL